MPRPPMMRKMISTRDVGGERCSPGSAHHEQRRADDHDRDAAEPVCEPAGQEGADRASEQRDRDRDAGQRIREGELGLGSHRARR